MMVERDFTSARAKEAILPEKKKEQIDLIPEKAMSGIWHDGKEVPHTGRIMFESADKDYKWLGFAFYNRENDIFHADDEKYWHGPWKRSYIKRWIYEQDLLML